MRGGPTPSTRRCLRTQVTTCEFYGALACEVDALVDTGSPATIVNEALATAAGLFAIEDAEDEQGTTTTGLGGAATALAAVPGGGHPRGRVRAAAVADGARRRPAAVGGSRRRV